MEVQDALEVNGKVIWNGDKAYYAKRVTHGTHGSDGLRWFCSEDDCPAGNVRFDKMMGDLWEPYLENEIVPEKQGELWEHDDGSIGMTGLDRSSLADRSADPTHIIFTTGMFVDLDIYNIVHGKNWTRVCPEVKEGA